MLRMLRILSKSTNNPTLFSASRQKQKQTFNFDLSINFFVETENGFSFFLLIIFYCFETFCFSFLSIVKPVTDDLKDLLSHNSIKTRCKLDDKEALSCPLRNNIDEVFQQKSNGTAPLPPTSTHVN